MSSTAKVTVHEKDFEVEFQEKQGKVFAKCHINNSQELALPAGLLPTNSPRSLIPVMPPIQAACLACHATTPAAAHAVTSTSALGESCETCHGTNAAFSIDKMHAR